MSTSRKTDGAESARPAPAPANGSTERVSEGRPQHPRKAAAAAIPAPRVAATAPVTTTDQATTKTTAKSKPANDGDRKHAPAAATQELPRGEVLARPQRASTAAPIREVASPREPKNAASAGLDLLLRIEAMARNAADLTELRHLIANETRKLNRARQIFVVEIAQGGAPRTVAASGVAALDQHSTLAGAIEQLVARMGAEQRLADAIELTLPAYCAPDSELALAYPFREMLWLPLLDRGKSVFAGLIFNRLR